MHVEQALLIARAEQGHLRPNPTRFDHLNPGAADSAQINGVIADLERSRVPIVVVSDFWEGAWGPPGQNAALEDWLNAHYAEVARHGSYRLLAAEARDL